MKQTKTSTYQKTCEKTYNRFLCHHELLDDSGDVVDASMIAEEIREHINGEIEHSMEHGKEASLTITVTIEEN